MDYKRPYDRGRSFQSQKSSRSGAQDKERTGIFLYDGEGKWEGQSGRVKSTEEHFKKYGFFDEFNDSIVPQPATGQDGSKYTRNWKMCAESNALGRYFEHTKKNVNDWTKEDFQKVLIGDAVQGDVVKEPCNVCSQWIKDGKISWRPKNFNAKKGPPIIDDKDFPKPGER